jgi:phage-related minor tail protein
MGGLGKFAVGALGITATAAIAAGAALLKIGSDFDEATDLIAIKTGATGAQLDTLTADMKAVFSSVPVSAKEAGEAIASVNQRFGLTGPAAQAAATQFLNLARITGQEVVPMIDSAAKVFSAFGVETAQQNDALDMMFVASQKSGIGIAELTGGLQKFGPTLRQMGFDITESTSLIAGWEKAGLNGDVMLAGLGIASKKLAAEGIPVREGLADQIAKMTALGPGTDQTRMAVELFGKSGLTMADAINKGAFANKALYDQLLDTDDNINTTAKSTDDWTQKLEVMKNKLLVAVAPAADAVFNGLGALIEYVTPFVEQLALWIGENLPGAMEQAGAFLKKLQPAFEALGKVLGFIGEYGLPIVGAAFGVLGTTIDGTIRVISTLVGWFQSAWQAAQNLITAISNIPAVQGIMGAIGSFAGGFAEGGSFIANRPTMAMFGEGNGPELVTATPLSRGIEAPGGGHGHPIVLDGRLVGGLIGDRYVRGAAFAGSAIG